MENEVNIDQSLLAEDLSNKIKLEFAECFLVKPLDKIKVKKEFSKPVATDTAKKDKNGVEAVDYDKVETEVKEVDSDFREGIVLKVPYNYQQYMKDPRLATMPVNVGDTVIYRDMAGKFFDLLKDTQIIKNFDIIAKKSK